MDCRYVDVDVLVSVGVNHSMVDRTCALHVLASRVYRSKIPSIEGIFMFPWR
jgi:hypothetical protein